MVGAGCDGTVIPEQHAGPLLARALFLSLAGHARPGAHHIRATAASRRTHRQRWRTGTPGPAHGRDPGLSLSVHRPGGGLYYGPFAAWHIRPDRSHAWAALHGSTDHTTLQSILPHASRHGQ